MSKTGQWINNVKEVIRVTLVGIDPSDQVQIKGYLRILLRVDFDIEWVSPKNPKVDLFIVNQAFSNSESIKSLINTSQSPVLYIAHDEVKSNVIENNTLFLKLEHVAILETWLNQNVPLIYETYNADKLVTSSASTGTQLNEEALRRRSANQSANQQSSINQQASATTPSFNAQTPTEKKAPTITANAVTLINTLNKRSSESYFEITNESGAVIAIIKPKERLVWPKGETFFPVFSLNWQVKEIQPQGYEIKHAMNLNSWVWQCALAESSDITKALPLDSKLFLKTWPKPKNDPKKSDYLRIMAMTELTPLSVDELTKKSGIAIETVHRCMSALYMAGFMDTGLLTLDVYVKQQVNASNLANSVNQTLEMTTVDGKVVSSNEEIEQHAADTSSKFKYGKDEVPAITKDKAVGGILSRIRSTLGF